MRKLLLILSFLFVFDAVVQSQPASATHSSATQKQTDLRLPAIGNARAVVTHQAYVLEYNEACEQALWVAYLLTSQHAAGDLPRHDHFCADKAVPTGSATLADYRKSGFDRGHLAPCADMRWSTATMAESFLMSNMSPQTHAFNAGVWSRLEEQVRHWALAYDSLYVVTGPVLTANLPSIGPNGVCVPEYFYKVILDRKRHQAIGIIMKHENSNLPLKTFAVTVDSVEHLTGLDFYPALPDAEEEALESNLCIKCWNWE